MSITTTRRARASRNHPHRTCRRHPHQTRRPTVDLDPETGEFVVDDDGNVALLDGGILVRWEEVEHLEFIDA
jgi:hypothetical protein